MIRHENVLRNFDPIIYTTLQEHMEKTGIIVHKNTNVQKVTSTAADKDLSKPFPKTVHTDKGDIDVDALLWAVGRKPNTETLGLEKVNVETDKGVVKVDNYQETNVKV